ncbi:type II toxin-antitoxin system PemK/MazF family toxin [Xylella fastidiosa]|uniref:type II toxin-antitoxin system PemK/MazF family toxin n=1 Tax=Xylella fastidiosa TaxID=2371 RepID=UPI0030B9A806
MKNTGILASPSFSSHRNSRFWFGIEKRYSRHQPTAGHEQRGYRPVVVISSERFNQQFSISLRAIQ